MFEFPRKGVVHREELRSHWSRSFSNSRSLGPKTLLPLSERKKKQIRLRFTEACLEPNQTSSISDYGLGFKDVSKEIHTQHYKKKKKNLE